jgi:hypothetical protein
MVASNSPTVNTRSGKRKSGETILNASPTSFERRRGTTLTRSVRQRRRPRAELRRKRRRHPRTRLSDITNRRSDKHADAIDAAENGLCDRRGNETVAAFDRAHNLGHAVKQGAPRGAPPSHPLHGPNGID